jgi:hypothetical protein
MKEAQKTPVGKGNYAFEKSPLSKAAAAIERGNKRAAQAQSAEMAKRCQPSAQRQFISRAAMLLNEQGGHKMPVGAVAIADFNRARTEGTSAPTAPTTAPKATKTTSKSKVKLTLADRIKALSPAKKAELKQRLDAFNAGQKVKAATKSKPSAQAAPRPASPADSAPAPVSTIKVSKGSRWSVALGKLASLSLGRAAL